MEKRMYKFRAWDGEKMLKSVPIEAVSSGTSLEMMGTNLILMQYTGLKDKNGKEIYEGDICTQTFGSNPQDKGEVTIDITRGVMVGIMQVWHHNVEIIGNIYETPELLTPSSSKEGNV